MSYEKAKAKKNRNYSVSIWLKMIQRIKIILKDLITLK